jgi:AcrR family transcriptional regulator
MSIGTANPTGTKGVPKAERAEQMLTVAIEEFAARGYANASMAEIAAQAGISKPLVYQYFGSKDGLYLACLHRVAGSLVARLEAAQLDEDDSVLARVTTLQAVFEALAPQPTAWRLLYDTTLPAVGEIAEAATGYQIRTAELATRGSQRFLLARGRSEALDASALGAVWMGLVNSLVSWWLLHPEQSAADMTDRARRLITAVLG